MRRGMGKGRGMGYKNIVPRDPYVHGLSAKGVKTYAKLTKKQKKAIGKGIGTAIGLVAGAQATRGTGYEGIGAVAGGYAGYKIGEQLSAKGTLNASYDFEPIEVIRKGNKRGEIYQDENPESPREWDNMGTMVAFHNRYDLGDKTDLKSDMFDGWEELHDFLVKEKKAEIVLPIYLYDHSGLRMKIGSFYGHLPQGHAEFDSGQVGYIYVTANQIKENFQVKKITQKILKRADKVLQGEVGTYDQYLMGDVYGYQIIEEKPVTVTRKYKDGTTSVEKTKEDVDVDSCWGFYGIDTVRDEVNSMLGVKK